MTIGSGLFIDRNEKDPIKQNVAIQQLIEGRSNAVGSFTLTSNASATSTSVSAPNCGPNSTVLCFPQSTAAPSGVAVKAADVSPGHFIVTHPATSTAGISYWFACLG